MNSGISSAQQKWNVNFQPEKITIHMHENAVINLTVSGLNPSSLIENNATISVRSDDPIAVVDKVIPLNEISAGQWTGNFNIDAIFLGNAKVYVQIEQNGSAERSSEQLPIIIIREERFIDKLFVISVASLVSILYINFGAALDLSKIRGIFTRPIGPIIGGIAQFLLLPLVSC